MAIDLTKGGFKFAPKAATPTPEPEKPTESKPVAGSLKLTIGVPKLTQVPKSEATPTPSDPPPKEPAITVSGGNQIEPVPPASLGIVPTAPDSPDMSSLERNLKELDDLFVEGQGYPSLVLSSVRDRIAAVMTELKEKPELQSILRAQDTRNIMAFVQVTQTAARVDFEEKARKSVSRASKKAKTAARNFDFSGLRAGMDKAAVDAAKASGPIDMSALGAMDVSKIPVKRTR